MRELKEKRREFKRKREEKEKERRVLIFNTVQPKHYHLHGSNFEEVGLY